MVQVAEMRLKTYRHTHGRTMATPAVAQMTATMLYGKRLPRVLKRLKLTIVFL